MQFITPENENTFYYLLAFLVVCILLTIFALTTGGHDAKKKLKDGSE